MCGYQEFLPLHSPRLVLIYVVPSRFIFIEHTIKQYNFQRHANNDFLFVEIRKAIYGLQKVGALANTLLKERLSPAGYSKDPHIPGLWTDITRPIQFTLVLDEFGVKFTGK